MVRCYSIDGITPVVDPTAFVHPTAVLIGDVIVGPGVYVGPLASLRGDFGRIVIERGSNIQDCCILHAFPDHDLVVEEDGHIGHAAILHGCIVRRNGMVGMNSVVMDKAVVGESAIVAAQSFVKTAFEIPPRMLAGGSPAKLMRELTEVDMNWKIQGTSVYHDLVGRCHAGLVETEPLAMAEPNRKRLQLPELKTLPETRREKG